MNINELVHSWLLATDKMEHRASGEDELYSTPLTVLQRAWG